MEQLFKKIMSFMVVAALFVACSSDSSPSGPDDTEEPKEVEVGIESFGFYQEDNPEILFDDYVVEDISGTEIDIDLPAEADVTSLVARFTTTDNDVVTVNDEEQESGVTENDFSNPLEYLVSEEDENEIYTVTVGEMARAVWSELAAYTGEDVRDISLGINPVNSLPSVAYIPDRDEFDDRKLNMVSFEEGSWSSIGSADFTSARARNPKLAYDGEGVPYISFGDNSTDPMQASVMQFANGAWSYLGGAPHSGIEADDVNALSIGEDGTVYGFYRDENRGAKLSAFESGGWTDVTITGREGNSMALVAEESNGDIYLGVLNFGSVSMYKYSDGSWTTLADAMTMTEETTVYWYDIAMDVDDDGNVYLAYAENNGSGSDYQLHVNRYSSENDSWSTAGQMIATTEVRTFDVAVDVYGNPIVLYKDDTENPTAVAFDDEVNNWSDPVTLDNAEADDLNIEVAPNGVAYASYTVNNQIRLQKYDSPDNN